MSANTGLNCIAKTFTLCPHNSRSLEWPTAEDTVKNSTVLYRTICMLGKCLTSYCIPFEPLAMSFVWEMYILLWIIQNSCFWNLLVRHTNVKMYGNSGFTTCLCQQSTCPHLFNVPQKNYSIWHEHQRACICTKAYVNHWHLRAYLYKMSYFLSYHLKRSM